MQVTAVQLARQFSQEMRSELTAEEMKKAITLNAMARNQAVPDLEICHTGDFCDSNQVMLNAMEVLGVSDDVVWSEDNATVRLVIEAWQIAKAADFNVNACYAIGSVVKYVKPLDQGEIEARFKVIELRGKSVLAEEICSMTLRPCRQIDGCELVEAQ